MTCVVEEEITRTSNWLYGGISYHLAGNGGPDCVNFLSLERRFYETTLAIFISLVSIIWSYRRLSVPSNYSYVRKDRGGRRILLVLLSLVWGIEIGLKFANQSLIFLLNPCHITTAIQLYLLAAPPSKTVTWLFRIHLNFLNGAFLAILFPVTNTRELPFETEIYWIQHIAMLIVPYYLLRLGGVYTIEKLTDLSWSFLSFGILMLYHFVGLQSIGMLTYINLNNMICPAISDPFYGPNYRLCAIVHQGFFVPFACKFYCAVSSFFLTKFPPTKVKKELGDDVNLSTYSAVVGGDLSLMSEPKGAKRDFCVYHRRTRSEANSGHSPIKTKLNREN